MSDFDEFDPEEREIAHLKDEIERLTAKVAYQEATIHTFAVEKGIDAADNERLRAALEEVKREYFCGGDALAADEMYQTAVKPLAAVEDKTNED